jgi:hypothetical protein
MIVERWPEEASGHRQHQESGRIVAHMGIVRSVFGCASCGQAWTPPLRRLPAWIEQDGRWDVCSDSPVGTWSLRPEPRGRPGCPVALNLENAPGLLIHPEVQRSIGCCGISYREQKPNLLCPCGAEAAYRLSDGDHCNHAAFVAATPLETIECDEPDDATLLARFTSRREATALALPDAGMDAIPRHLRVIADGLWNDDLQTPALFPALSRCSMQVSGLEVRLALDGLWIRPPWPDGERDRAIALGVLPRGRADDPLSWWSDQPAGAPAANRHQWWQWCVDGELCVAWQRGQGTTFNDPEAVAFRLPAELWELAWREALHASAP